MDYFPTENQKITENIYVSGWCYCTQYPEITFYYELDALKTEIPVNTRPDVQNVFGLSFNNVGFSANILTEGLSFGNHNLKIYAENYMGIEFEILNINFIYYGAKKTGEFSKSKTTYVVYESNMNYEDAVKYAFENEQELADLTTSAVQFLKPTLNAT